MICLTWYEQFKYRFWLYVKLMTSGRFFNRGVMALDVPHIGYVVRETQLVRRVKAELE